MWCLDLMGYKLHEYLNSSQRKNLSLYSLIEAWLMIALVALAHNELEWPKNFSHGLPLTVYSSIEFEFSLRRVSQTSFSLYLHNQWTNFHKLSCFVKPQIRDICTYVGYTKVTTNNRDIRPSATVKALFANISWITRWIHMIKLVLESAHQIVSNNI